jgi:hypothetical protein
VSLTSLRTLPPSVGAVMAIDGSATWMVLTSLTCVWPALSSTTAAYCTIVPGSSAAMSWKTR